jgi:hypothetical protein
MNTIETKALKLIANESAAALTTLKQFIRDVPGFPIEEPLIDLNSPPTYVKVDTRYLLKIREISDQLNIALSWSNALLTQNTVEKPEEQDETDNDLSFTYGH